MGKPPRSSSNGGSNNGATAPPQPAQLHAGWSGGTGGPRLGRPASVSGQSWGWASGVSGSTSAMDPAEQEAASDLEGWLDVSSTAAVPATLRAVRPPAVPPLFTDAAGAMGGPLRVCSACWPALQCVPDLRPAQIRAAGSRLRTLQKEAQTAVALHRQGLLDAHTQASLRASSSGTAALAAMSSDDALAGAAALGHEEG